MCFVNELYIGVFDVIMDYFDEVFGVVSIYLCVVGFIVDVGGDFF